MKRGQQSAMAALGAPAEERSSREVERCPAGCGGYVQYGIDALGYLIAAPCDMCARLAGRARMTLVRGPRPDPAEQLARDLADVLLYFTTKWNHQGGAGRSYRQRNALKQRVAALLARITLPALLPAGWKPEPPSPPPRPRLRPGPVPKPKVVRTHPCSDCGATLSGRVWKCDACRAPNPRPARAPRVVGPHATPVCVVCGAPLSHERQGRPPKYCDAHRPKKLQRKNDQRRAKREAAQRARQPARQLELGGTR